MAEIVPNRVPCGNRPTPPPKPQPEPTPVTLCQLTGVKYFKLQSDIPGDYTKNCGLLGNEIDENFYFLRSMDIKTAYTELDDDCVKPKTEYSETIEGELQEIDRGSLAAYNLGLTNYESISELEVQNG